MTRTRRSIAPSSMWAASYLRPSSAAFITIIAESSFRHGHGAIHFQRRFPGRAQTLHIGFNACPFRKFHPVGIRAVRQNHRIIRVDAFEGAKLSHGETVSGKATGRPPLEGRHPRCRPRARAHRPSIRPSPPGTVQGLLRRALHTVRTAPEEPWHRSNPNLDNPP